MAVEFSKSKDLKAVRVEVSWEQPEETGGGLLGGIRNRVNRTDVDVSAVAFAQSSGGGAKVPVDYVSPKKHPATCDGSIVHSGDVKKGTGDAGEVITIELGKLDDDITAIALALTCVTGAFNKITNTKATFFDQNGDRLGQQRFDITTSRNGAVVGALKKTGTAWDYVDVQRYGDVDVSAKALGESWRALASIAKDVVR